MVTLLRVANLYRAGCRALHLYVVHRDTGTGHIPVTVVVLSSVEVYVEVNKIS